MLKTNKKEITRNGQSEQAPRLAAQEEGNDGRGAQETQGALRQDGSGKRNRTEKASRVQAHSILESDGWSKESAKDLAGYMTESAAENDGSFPSIRPVTLDSIRNEKHRTATKQAIERLQAKGLEVFLYTDSSEFAGGYTANGRIYLNVQRRNINFVAEHEHAHILATYVMRMKAYLLDNAGLVNKYHKARNIDLERQGYQAEAFDFDNLATELACDVYAQLRTGEESASSLGMSDMELQELCEQAAQIVDDIVGDDSLQVADKPFYERRSFGEQVDEVVAGTFDKTGNLVYVGMTPQSLRNILDWPDLPVLMRPEKVYQNFVSEEQAKQDGRFKQGESYHALGRKLKNINNLLNAPVAIIKSTTDDGDLRIVTVTMELDDSGDVIVAALDVDQLKRNDKRIIFANTLLSVYGKDSLFSFFQAAASEDRILFVDKQKNQRLPVAGGLQLPVGITDADYSSNLTQYKQLVNSRTEKNSAKYSMQNDAQKDTSKHTADETLSDGSYSRTKGFNESQANSESNEKSNDFIRLTDEDIDNFPGSLYEYLEKSLPTNEASKVTQMIQRIDADARTGQLRGSYLLITSSMCYNICIRGLDNYSIGVFDKNRSDIYEREFNAQREKIDRAAGRSRSNERGYDRNSMYSHSEQQGWANADSDTAREKTTHRATGKDDTSGYNDGRVTADNSIHQAPSNEGAFSSDEKTDYSRRRGETLPIETSKLASLTEEDLTNLVSGLKNVRSWALPNSFHCKSNSISLPSDKQFRQLRGRCP